MKKKASTRKPLSARKSAPKQTSSGKESESFWTMRLYVAGQSPRSNAAIANLRRICDEHMPGRYEVQVIDLARNPELARMDQIVAIPTLVKKMPTPVRRIIGDLSATDKVLLSLELV
jgi:circadian clock protein KaiB